MDEHKLCYCEHEGILETEVLHQGEKGRYYFIGCSHCINVAPYSETPEEAWTAWNKQIDERKKYIDDNWNDWQNRIVKK